MEKTDLDKKVGIYEVMKFFGVGVWKSLGIAVMDWESYTVAFP